MWIPRPVGVFDSVGGLSVLHECLVTMPRHNDSSTSAIARVCPMAPLSLKECQRLRASRSGVYLQSHQEQRARRQRMQHLRRLLRSPSCKRSSTVPVVGANSSGGACHRARQAAGAGSVLLATEGTVAGRRGPAELVCARSTRTWELVSVSRPELVPLIESEGPVRSQDDGGGARRTRRRSRKRRSTR